MSTINRRDLLGGTAAVLGAGMLGAKQASAAQRPAAPTGAGKRPNLVLFFLDELRADALSCYGNPVTKTPNFDAFAKSGTRFANCHVQNPVCTQSRCSMLTGWPTSVPARGGDQDARFHLRRASARPERGRACWAVRCSEASPMGWAGERRSSWAAAPAC